MNYNHIIFSSENNIAIIKLNRPDVLNSFNAEMAAETKDALKKCEENENIRAILITGEGRAFCAGQDLAEAMKAGNDLAKIVREQYNPIIKLIRNIEKPIVAAINGVAAGAGANIAFACDIVVAADSASFIQSFSKIGLIPDSGGTFFLPRIAGFSRAAAMMMLGEKITAEKALSYGLIYKVIDDENLFSEAKNLTKQLAAMPTKGLGLTKKLLNQSYFNDLGKQLDLEEKIQDEAGHTNDYTEGVNAFLEKRKPQFTGS
jgi:2-(1,2-epoxy-1,2-dihydrophenyl)acetyl-CoA isomerase